MRTLALAVCLLLTGCGEPRSPVVSRDQALADTRLLDLRVLTIHDALRVPGTSSDGASHFIEVEITGPADLAGKRVCLPYDEWMMGRPPPAKGRTLRTAPRTWLTGDGSSKGKPFGGWDGNRPMDR